MRPADFRRRACPVQALPMLELGDLDAAELWLSAHGVRKGRLGDVLIVYGEGIRMPLRLGQWLVHDPASGAFEVWDHGRFLAEHERGAA